MSRKEMLDSYIKHIRRGLSDGSFPDMDMQMLEAAISKCSRKKKRDIEKARRERLLKWEEYFIPGGENKVPPAVWLFCMKCNFGWNDKIIKDNSIYSTIEEIIDEAEPGN